MQILVVDDDKDQVKSLCIGLRSKGFATFQAFNADQALTLLKDETQSIDLMVTDYTMPGMSGLELLNSMKKTTGAIPVILMTADGNDELTKEAFGQGCKGVLEKPFTVDELIREIQNIIEKEAGGQMNQLSSINDEMPGAKKGGTGKYLTFSLENEEYGIGILGVKEIIGMMPITSVPRTPDFVKGVINLRGKVIPVLDLRLKFSMAAIEYTERTCIIVVEIESDSGTVLIGNVVDAVSEVLSIQEEDVEQAPTFGTQLDTDYILGMAKIDGGVKILLDIDKVLSSQELKLLEKTG